MSEAETMLDAVTRLQTVIFGLVAGVSAAVPPEFRFGCPVGPWASSCVTPSGLTPAVNLVLSGRLPMFRR